ncbi:MAG: Trm112 family protein [Candidatus Marinimicrobia bacterium]|nr:Trm112 family protein [Candidatus Neomarinimicrobiota bacterium]MBT7377789.1 Trm112 family protein [Candidatus Neomarinimicrobiota bacterium]
MDNILSCPHCKNLFSEDVNASKLNCETCDIDFDVKEGIPILIPKLSEPLQK